MTRMILACCRCTNTKKIVRHQQRSRLRSENMTWFASGFVGLLQAERAEDRNRVRLERLQTMGAAVSLLIHQSRSIGGEHLSDSLIKLGDVIFHDFSLIIKLLFHIRFKEPSGRLRSIMHF